MQEGPVVGLVLFKTQHWKLCNGSTMLQAMTGGCETHRESIRSKSLFGIQRLSRLDEDLVCSWNVAQRDQRELQGVHSACTVQASSEALSVS